MKRTRAGQCLWAGAHLGPLVLALVLLVSGLSAAPRERLGPGLNLEFTLPRYDGAIINRVAPERFETPHTPFAKPLPGGPLRVLFFGANNACDGRDVAELFQRLDMTMETVMFNNPDSLGQLPLVDNIHDGGSDIQKTARMLELLDDSWDVIVLGNVNMGALPVPVYLQVLAQVRDGTGLVVYFGRNVDPRFWKIAADREFDPAPLTDTCAYSSLSYLDRYPDSARPEDVMQRTLKGGAFGKGRVLAFWLSGRNQHATFRGGSLGYIGQTGFGTYETALELSAHALMWAAGRELPVQAVCNLEEGALADGPVRFSVTRTPEATGMRLNCAYAFQDNAGSTVHRGEIPIAGNRFDIPLPPGQMPLVLHYVLRNEAGEVADWGSRTISRPRSVDFRVESDTKICRRTESPVISVLLDPIPADATIEFRVKDAYDRIVHTQTLQIEEVREQFTVDLSHALGRYAACEVTLFADGEMLDRRRLDWFLHRRKDRDFMALIWSVAAGNSYGEDTYMNQLTHRQLRQAGFTHGMSFGRGSATGGDTLDKARFFSKMDMGWMVYAASIRDESVFQLFDPAYRERTTAALTRMAADVAPFGTDLYSLGDENRYTYAMPINGHTLAALQNYLKNRYGNQIAVLNHLWRTDYVDFTDIEPLKDPTLDREGVPVTRRYDQFCFWEWAYAEGHRVLAEAIRKGDPEALVGAEGSMPANLAQTIEHLDWWAPYPDPYANLLLTSWLPTAHRGNWAGGNPRSMTAPRYLGAPYFRQLLFSGAVNSMMYFQLGNLAGPLNPDLSFADDTLARMDDDIYLYRGPGPLLEHSALTDDGVAVLWSRENELAAYFQPVGEPANLARKGHLRGGQYELTQMALTQGLSELGVNARATTVRDLSSRRLTASECNVLFLCASQHLPEDARMQLQRYVEDGGMLIADIATGRVDERMRMTSLSAGLRSLLGLDVEQWPELVRTEPNMQVQVDDHMVSLHGTTWTHRNLPVMQEHSIGQGRVVFLNLALGQLMQAHNKAFLTALLDWANIRPSIRQISGPALRAIRFNHADSQLLGMTVPLRESGRPRMAETVIQLVEPRRVFDLKLGREMGMADRLTVPADAVSALYALLPDAEREVEVESPPTVIAGRTFTVNAELNVGGQPLQGSLLRVDLHNPRGARTDHYTRFVFSGGESANVQMPLALNDAAGAWRAVVTELCSGTRAEVTFEVLAPDRSYAAASSQLALADLPYQPESVTDPFAGAFLPGLSDKVSLSREYQEIELENLPAKWAAKAKWFHGEQKNVAGLIKKEALLSFFPERRSAIAVSETRDPATGERVHPRWYDDLLGFYSPCRGGWDMREFLNFVVTVDGRRLGRKDLVLETVLVMEPGGDRAVCDIVWSVPDDDQARKVGLRCVSLPQYPYWMWMSLYTVGDNIDLNQVQLKTWGGHMTQDAHRTYTGPAVAMATDQPLPFEPSKWPYFMVTTREAADCGSVAILNSDEIDSFRTIQSGTTSILGLKEGAQSVHFGLCDFRMDTARAIAQMREAWPDLRRTFYAIDWRVNPASGRKAAEAVLQRQQNAYAGTDGAKEVKTGMDSLLSPGAEPGGARKSELAFGLRLTGILAQQDKRAIEAVDQMFGNQGVNP